MTFAMKTLLTGRGSRDGLWQLPFILALLIAGGLAVSTREFLSVGNLLNLFGQAMPLVITSMGQMFVVLLGGLDLSVGSVISFTTAVLALGRRPTFLCPASSLWRRSSGSSTVS